MHLESQQFYVEMESRDRRTIQKLTGQPLWSTESDRNQERGPLSKKAEGENRLLKAVL